MPWWVSNFAFFSHPAWPSVSICLPFWLYTALHWLSIWWKIWLLLLCNHHIMAGGNISVHLVFAPALWEDRYQLELFCKLVITWYTFTFDIKCILTECSLSWTKLVSTGNQSKGRYHKNWWEFKVKILANFPQGKLELSRCNWF